MPRIDIRERFGSEIDSLWSNTNFQNVAFEKIKGRGYAVPQTVAKKSLLFIGINPSFNKGDKHGNKYYPEDNSHRYFAKFRVLSERTALCWTHMDLLFIRETNQKNVVNFWSDESGNRFLLNQLSVSKAIMENAKPAVIVVNNTFARDLLRDSAKLFEFAFDDDLGTEKIINSITLEGTPVFFTSMLTGQRALDNGSFDRLAWHIRFAYNKTMV